MCTLACGITLTLTCLISFAHLSGRRAVRFRREQCIDKGIGKGTTAGGAKPKFRRSRVSTTHRCSWQIRCRTRPSSAEMLGEGDCVGQDDGEAVAFGWNGLPWRQSRRRRSMGKDAAASHAMGTHRLLATSGCDIGIEFLIEIVRDRCMFGASLYVWGIFPRPDPRRGRGGSPDAREDIVAARELLISEARPRREQGDAETPFLLAPRRQLTTAKRSHVERPCQTSAFLTSHTLLAYCL